MSSYVYRRRLTRRELLPAVAAGLGAGAVVAYVAQLFLRRAPLRPADDRGGRP